MTADEIQQFNSIPWPESVIWKESPALERRDDSPCPLPLELQRGFWGLKHGASRYYFYDNLSPDWKTWRSWRDFWFFGIWTNKQTLEIITFAEGDITYERYASPEDFRLRLQSLPEPDND